MGVHLNAIFLPLNMGLIWKYLVHVSSNPKNSRLKHEVCKGCFLNFWEVIIFLKGFVKVREIRDIEDLVKF